MKKPAKLRKIPGLIIYFPSGFRYARNEIANRLDISERLVYRYFKDLKDVDFIIPPPKDSDYLETDDVVALIKWQISQGINNDDIMLYDESTMWKNLAVKCLKEL